MLLLPAALFFLQAALGEAAGGWVYANKGATVASASAQAASWGGLCVTGKEQSPINVVTATVVKTILPAIITRFDTKVTYVKNTGHGLQLFETSPKEHKYSSNNLTKVVVDDDGPAAKGYSMIGGSKYNFYQVHWHTPSENAIDGKNYAMEAHFVHQLADGGAAPSGVVGTYHRLAVLGLLYSMGTAQQCNTFLDYFWDFFPEATGIKEYSGAHSLMDFNKQLTEELARGYYHWMGSLTTPPCTEGVSWNLFKLKELVCNRQVQTLKRALEITQNGVPINNRVTQPLNHRAVSSVEPGNPRPMPANTLILPAAATKWVYAAKGATKADAAQQKATWGGLCIVGHEQSPINVITMDTVKSGLPSIATHFDTHDTHKAGQSLFSMTYVSNTGHGFQIFETSPKGHTLDTAGKPAASVNVHPAKGYSMISGDKFNFYQIHWHTPSENAVDGHHYAMEAHFVHQLNDTALHGGYHRLAVIGMLYAMGTATDCNAHLAMFWDQFPMDKGYTAFTSAAPDFNLFLATELKKGYYHWMGSLTTPPCTEGVSWNLISTAQKCCPAQVIKLTQALAQTQDGLGFNNRVTQPLNHRIVTEMSLPISEVMQTNVSDAQWKIGIEVALKQGMYTQKMTKDFLFVAKGMEVVKNKADMLYNIASFDQNLLHLMEGTADGEYAACPTQRILEQFYDVQFKWVSLKRLLVDNVDTVNTNGVLNYDVLEFLYLENLPTLLSSDEAGERYKNAARINGATVQTLRVDIAGRQRMLTQKMSKEATFIGLEVHTTESLSKLSATAQLFTDAHLDIVRGVGSIAEMPELDDMCTLYEMKTVNGKWNKMQPYISTILDEYKATDYGLENIATTNLILLEEMNKALYMYTHIGENTCDPEHSMDEASWMNAIAELGKQRMLIEKSTSMFFQIVRGVDVATATQNIQTALIDGERSIRLAIEGSYYLNVPSPPNQVLVDQLMYAQFYWSKFSTHIQSDLRAADLMEVDLSRLTHYGGSCLRAMNTVASTYINASLRPVGGVVPDRASVVLEIAWRQMTLLQRMSAQGFLFSLGRYVAETTAQYAVSVEVFKKQHAELLHGRSAGGHRRLAAAAAVADNGSAVVEPGMYFLATKDACTLSSMANTLTAFEAMKHHLDKVASGEIEEHDDLIYELQQLLHNRDESSHEMSISARNYALGTSQCTTVLSRRQWESGLQLAGKTSQYFQEAQKDYFLLASGLAAVWEAEAENHQLVHTESISDDVESPMVEEALVAFNDGWFKMAQDDNDRSFELKNAYIVQNPNPVGSKGLFEFAPGNQDYHLAHKTYHKYFRDNLIEKNYFDILMVDARGNVVYTVNKRGEFATNVGEKHPGEWGDSVLAEAYRGAKHDPEQVFASTWDSYGPNHGAMAAFLAKAIRSAGGQILGVYATQMPPEAKPIECEKLLAHAVHQFDALLESLEFGVHALEIPPPPTQGIADRVFGMYDQWQILRNYLTGSIDMATVENIRKLKPGFVAAAEALDREFMLEAWAAHPEVPGMKISLVNAQLTRAQSLSKDVVLMYMKDMLTSTPPNYEVLMQTIKEYEETSAVLLGGQTGVAQRRLVDEYVPQMNDVAHTDDPYAVKLMEDSDSAFEGLKASVAYLLVIPEGESEPTASVSASLLRTTIEATDETVTATEQSLSFFADKLDLITLQPLSILAPMPLTGAWNAGKTMRTSAILAQGIINEEQIILPGYSLNHVFFDDKCDSTTSSQIVLREISLSKYVALGGAGCSAVCAGTAFIAASVRLPFLSYECAGDELSDTTQYPDLTRMGTTTTQESVLIRDIGELVSDWNYVEVISGDPSKYRIQGEALAVRLADTGLSSEYAYAYDTEWTEIVDLMDQLRIKKRRVVFVLGSESYFRKVVCASIVAGSAKGIAWLSQGTWRDNWWKTTDSLLDSYRQWMGDDAKAHTMRDALTDFTAGWNALPFTTDEERFNYMREMYFTDLKDALDFVPTAGNEAYHLSHKTHHPLIRDLLLSRNYDEIYFLDTKGNMIYSVFKDLDFGTNFGSKTSGDKKYVEWQNSNLAHVYREAITEPNVMHGSAHWEPYGPTAGSLASFMAQAITDPDDPTRTLGVFAARMPQEAMSIEDVQTECTLDNIAEKFEGAINFVGLGAPIHADLSNQVPCFAGRTAQAFLELIDDSLLHGYQEDDSTKVEQPYKDLKAHPADATCVFAYAIKHLMDERFSLNDINDNTEAVYAEFISYIKHQASFQGASGMVKFHGNDKQAYLGVYQVHEGHNKLVGTCSHNGTKDFEINGGPSNASWKPAHPDVLPPEDDFPFWAIQIFLPLLCICCPGIAACIANF